MLKSIISLKGYYTTTELQSYDIHLHDLLHIVNSLNKMSVLLYMAVLWCSGLRVPSDNGL